MEKETALEIEAKFHRRYFEPFDRLLEKMADRYLKLQEEGKEKRVLEAILKDIEVMERFREYVSILETTAQIHMEEIFRLSRVIDRMKKERTDVYLKSMIQDKELIDLMLAGQNKKQTPN